MDAMQEFTNKLSQTVRDNGGRGLMDGTGAMMIRDGKAISWNPPEGSAVDHAEVGSAARAIKLVSDLTALAAATDADPRLSDSAKAQDIDKAIDRAADELQIVENGIDMHATQLAEFEREFYGLARPADPVAVMEEQEIRGWFRTLDASARLSALRDAPANVIAALVRSPIPLPKDASDIANASWRALRDSQDPAKAKAIAGRLERIAWARTVLDHARLAMPKKRAPKPIITRQAA